VKGQVTDDAREATESAGHRLEQEQNARGREGDRRRDVAAPVEERPLAERRARSFRVEHLLTASRRGLTDLDEPFGDDEEAPAGLVFFEQDLSATEASRRAPVGQAPELRPRQDAEVRRPPEDFSAHR